MELTKVVLAFTLGTLLALAIAFISLDLATNMRYVTGANNNSKNNNEINTRNGITVFNGVLTTIPANSSIIIASPINYTSKNSLTVFAPLYYVGSSYYTTTDLAFFAIFKWKGELDIDDVSLSLKNVTVVVPYYLWATQSWKEVIETQNSAVFIEAPPNSTILINIMLNQPTNVSAFSIPGYLSLENYTVHQSGAETAISFSYEVSNSRNTLIVLPLIYGNFTYFYVIYVI